MKTYERIGNGSLLVNDGSVKYIEFECLNKFRDILTHCMSTRCGGVSGGECSTLNLSFNRNDARQNVIENFSLLCQSAGMETKSLVLTDQVHDTKVCTVGRGDTGKGFSRKSDLLGVDGLITATPGVTIVTFHADCVPVFLFEPVRKVAALLHSGWKGTLNNIAKKALDSLREIGGLRTDRLIAVIGPSIGRCCFEVDDDVFGLFHDRFPSSGFYEGLSGGKWKIDLKGIIEYELMLEGIPLENIHNSGICTKCSKELFFSYRGDGGKTGSLAAFMQIKS